MAPRLRPPTPPPAPRRVLRTALLAHADLDEWMATAHGDGFTEGADFSIVTVREADEYGARGAEVTVMAWAWRPPEHEPMPAVCELVRPRYTLIRRTR